MSDIRDFCPLWGEWEADVKIGEGSFGAVWRVKRNIIDGKVFYAAVKHISIPKDEGEINRLIGEGIFSDEASARHYYGQMLRSMTDEIEAMHILQGYTNIVTRTHKELDLTRQDQVEAFFAVEKPEFLFRVEKKLLIRLMKSLQNRLDRRFILFTALIRIQQDLW